ncbi:class D sortase [Clostridium sp. DJ247]|uniref:class D sortase n=1 Tax=Clostridium sp. DJ247 TaxID=2726188 RepID=UPI001627FE60|nr:class D sortase [Clostridium sp. DJ247]MBC2582422.1 class D sortase [Clostridium sp. DJ247]
MRKKIGLASIFIGICIISAALYMKYSADSIQKEMIRRFERGIITKYKNLTMDTIGIMTIGKINLKVAIGEGDDNETLKYSVGHIKGTAMPGEKGNFSVAGHRSYTYGEYFNRLDELEVGDKIMVKTKKGEYTYKIYDIKVVLPSDVSVLNKTDDATITLITCTPIRVATHRLIIKGKLES